MSPIYNTEELIQILAQERQACITGKRLNLTATASGSPFIDKFIKPDGIQKFTAYRNFRATIHGYQLEHQVSGIVWQTVQVKGKTLEYPEVHPQLIALPQDFELLKKAQALVLSFWAEMTTGMDLYLSVNRGRDYVPAGSEDVVRLSQRAEWLTLSKHEKHDFLELILQLGWGQPSLVQESWSNAEFGCESIHAVNPGDRPIG